MSAGTAARAAATAKTVQAARQLSPIASASTPAARMPNVVPVLTTDSTRSRERAVMCPAASLNGAQIHPAPVPASTTPTASMIAFGASATIPIPRPAETTPTTTGSRAPMRARTTRPPTARSGSPRTGRWR